MVERLSALRTILPRNIIFMFLVLISVRGLVRAEGLGNFKKITSSGIEPATFRFVA
jgi:hypothetical protein